MAKLLHRRYKTLINTYIEKKELLPVIKQNGTKVRQKTN